MYVHHDEDVKVRVQECGRCLHVTISGNLNLMFRTFALISCSAFYCTIEGISDIHQGITLVSKNLRDHIADDHCHSSNPISHHPSSNVASWRVCKGKVLTATKNNVVSIGIEHLTAGLELMLSEEDLLLDVAVADDVVCVAGEVAGVWGDVVATLGGC